MSSSSSRRRPYPSDVSDVEWEFVAPYLTLMKPDAPQREYALRDVFDALRWLVRTGSAWRYLPQTTFRRGKLCTSRPGGGSAAEFSR